MAFFGLFRNKKKKDIKVSQRRQKAMQDAAVAATFAEAGEHETARRMIDTAKGNKTILVIGQGDSFSERLVTYAVDMAQRFNFKLLAVNTTEDPLSLPAGKREEAAAAFTSECASNCTVLREKADAAGITLTHLAEVGSQDEILERLQARYPGMRYVLTEPEPDAVQEAAEDVSIPVFDLGSYQGAAV
jgi:hypothetical protein